MLLDGFEARQFLIMSTLIQDKTFGKIIYRHGGTLVLYRGRNYNPKKRPVVPLMLWRPHEPIYPKLIKTTIEGLSIEETKDMRKRGLAVPALTKLGVCLFFFYTLQCFLILWFMTCEMQLQLKMVTMVVWCLW